MNFGAERSHLLLDRRAHVGRRHNGAEPPSRGDGLKAGDAHAHDEHPRRRHRAGRSHHHRQRPLERCGGIDHGLVAREICLARQHVHALRAADARHQFHGEKGGAGLRQRLEARGVGEGIKHADEQGARLGRFDERQGRPPHREHDVGAAHCVRVGCSDARTGGLVVLIGEMGAQPCACADQHLCPLLDEFLRGLGADPDARLLRAFGGHANSDHRGSLG